MSAATSIRKGYADTPEGQVHYLRSGTGRPIVLLHQSPAAATMWEAVLPLFGAAGFEATALDLPGHGDSWRPKEPPSIPSYAQSVVAALDALGLAQVDLVGHHTGALVAAQVAADFPARVGKLALWGLAIYVEALAASRARLKNEPPPDYDEEGSELIAFWKRQRMLAGEAYTPMLGVRAMVEMLQTGAERPFGHWAGQKCDREPLLRRVTQPVLALGGERDPLWPGIEAAAKLFARGRFHVIPGAGLYVVDESPQEFVRLVRDFLEARQE
jgi:pimeloyl-ACP methyl ester carboxylesterase